jgi:excisionase family DNA binding protein
MRAERQRCLDNARPACSIKNGAVRVSLQWVSLQAKSGKSQGKVRRVRTFVGLKSHRPGGGRLGLSARQLFTVSEVAEATGFSANAIYRAISAGELRASKLRGRLRVQLGDLDGWIEANVVPFGGPGDEALTPLVSSARDGRGQGLRELLEVV